MPVAPRPTREHLDSEITSFLPAVLTGFDTVSFHSVGFEVYFDAVSTKCNVQACALAACTVSVISTNDVAYLPGLHAARPSAFVEGGGVEPPAHLSILGITAMRNGRPSIPLIPTMPVCANYPGFYLPILKFFILSVVKNQRASRMAGGKK